VTWMEIMDTCVTWLSRLENTHIQHSLLTWLELKRLIHFVNSCACLEFWTFSQMENVGDFLELKRPTCLPNSYAQSEIWTFSWVKRMYMIFWSFDFESRTHGWGFGFEAWTHASWACWSNLLQANGIFLKARV
jgi:hypothetical protein